MNEQTINYFFDTNYHLKYRRLKKRLKKTECPICFDETTICNTVIFDCKHICCVECFQKFAFTKRPPISLTCFFCRKNIDTIYLSELNKNKCFHIVNIHFYRNDYYFSRINGHHIFNKKIPFVILSSYSILILMFMISSFYHNLDK